ncbi:hypothetical protein TNCV_3876871 [Trichonephila clavipes]|uniref:Uncharacterized protein n=1 Tax=Trichonephila clavipes TaxID=2585209 RepID=A0A8X6VRG5_TRICX|nr:hypothetical protein TNCV_3876871 [Trichonephila clavipes]
MQRDAFQNPAAQSWKAFSRKMFPSRNVLAQNVIHCYEIPFPISSPTTLWLLHILKRISSFNIVCGSHNTEVRRYSTLNSLQLEFLEKNSQSDHVYTEKNEIQCSLSLNPNTVTHIYRLV